jgi:hypothetical protein
MIATVTPGNASNPAVAWSIIPGTGTASVNTGGLVTALTNGTVYAKAVSQDVPAIMDSLLITITGQVATGLPGNPGGNADRHLSYLSIYPVPAQNILHLKLTQNHPAVQVIITDITGHQVYQGSYPANGLRSEKVIDITRLTAGLYIIRFTGSQIEANFKFMKQ